MRVKVVTQDPISLVTLSAAKAQCGLMESQTIDDDLISGLIDTSSALAQSYVNKLLSSGSLMLGWETYRYKTQLWGDNISSVESVTATDPSGNSTEITEFKFDDFTGELIIPSSYSYHSDFRVSCTVTVQSVEPQVAHAIKIMINTFYNNREDYVAGLSVASMPMTSIHLLDSVKIRGL